MENFLFCKSGNGTQDQVLKLIDFGLSKRFVSNSVSEIESMIGDIQKDEDEKGGTVNFHQFVEAMYDGTGDYMRPYKTRALSMCVSSTTS